VKNLKLWTTISIVSLYFFQVTHPSSPLHFSFNHEYISLSKCNRSFMVVLWNYVQQWRVQLQYSLQSTRHACSLKLQQGISDPSGVLSSWSTKLDCCEWKGVMCNIITSWVTGITLPCSTTLPSYQDEEDKSHCLTIPFTYPCY